MMQGDMETEGWVAFSRVVFLNQMVIKAHLLSLAHSRRPMGRQVGVYATDISTVVPADWERDQKSKMQGCFESVM